MEYLSLMLRDFINLIFKDFHELHGDRTYSDDNAIVAGIAQFEGISVAVIGHQKGRGTNLSLIHI